MEKKTCSSCGKRPTVIQCELCKEPSCKKCSEFIDEDRFDLLSLLPENIVHKTFCPTCFATDVSSVIEDNQDTLERAKNVDIYLKDQSKETRLLQRLDQQFQVQDCVDREEATLMLAFLAAKEGFRTLVDVELTSKKVKISGKYTKLTWNGSAVPTKSGHQ